MPGKLLDAVGGHHLARAQVRVARPVEARLADPEAVPLGDGAHRHEGGVDDLRTDAVTGDHGNRVFAHTLSAFR